ncbi:MAG TPA: PfkB family carbohydrate kinase, partial [bacterium]|nr:PfkB family carbohydrate kinase [bacterium]
MIHLLNANPALDFDFKLSDPASGKIGAVESFTVSPGGKALNVARFLKALRVPARLWVPSGEREATQVLYFHLARRKDLSVQWVPQEGPVRANVVLHNSGGSAKFNHSGFPLSAAPWDRLLARRLRPGDLLALTGRLPAQNAGLYAGWIKTWQPKGVRVALDASGEGLRRAMAQRPWFLKVNLDEFNGAWAPACPTLTRVAAQVPKLRRKGLIHGAVTHGAEGALVWEGGRVLGVKNAAVKDRKLVVGAGDGFLAGYLAAVQAKLDLADRCRWASAAARVVAEKGI